MITPPLPNRCKPGRFPLPLCLLFMGGLILMVSSCATQRHEKALLLVNYVNQEILSLAPMEARALERYAAVTGENYRSDEEVYKALKDDTSVQQACSWKVSK